MPDDSLRQYTDHQDEAAFARFVAAHVDLVYSAALRQMGGDGHLAEDVCQAVFTSAARHAPTLAAHPNVMGWLYTTTRNEAARQLRALLRRRRRETAAALETETSAPAQAIDWEQVRPILDAAMHALGERDRQAVLLRFFAGKPFAQIGTVLGLSEDAARKRVERGLSRLRDTLAARGVTSTTAALGALLTDQAVGAAPPAFAARLAAASLAGKAASAGSVVLLMSKLKLGATVAALGLCGVLLWHERQAGLQLQSDVARLSAGFREAEAQLTAARNRLPVVSSPVATMSASVAATPALTDEARLAALRRRGALDNTYAGLFVRLKLDRPRLERLKTLLIEREDWAKPLKKILREEGMEWDDLSDAFIERARAYAIQDIDRRIEALLGSAAMVRAKAYIENPSLYGRCGDIAATTAGTDAAFTDEQIDRLVDTLAAARRAAYPDPDATPESIVYRMVPPGLDLVTLDFLSPAQRQQLEKYVDHADAWEQLLALNRVAARQGRLKLVPDKERHSPAAVGGSQP